MNKSSQTLNERIDRTPMYSTHEHHLEQRYHEELTLDRLFQHSYVNWCSLPEGPSFEERSRWLEAIRSNSYFVWLEKSICDIYNFDKITAGNWEDLSQTIQRFHSNPDFHWDILRNKSNYIGFMEDSYWEPGGNLSNDEFVVSTYRMDTWLSGFHSDCTDHDGMNPRLFTAASMDDLDAYEMAVRAEIEKRSNRVVALKCAAAYERTISFPKTEKTVASRIYGKRPEEVTTEERLAFGNYMFHVFLEIARERELPIQIHTGLAKLSGSNPMLLEPVIADNPDVRFVLFHGGFPWVYEIAALAHNYKNVHVDMNWLPLISTKAAETALHMYLEILPSNRNIAWGGDTWTSEEAYGAAMAFRFALKNVLQEKVASSFYRLADAEALVERLLYRNAMELYHLPPRN